MLPSAAAKSNSTASAKSILVSTATSAVLKIVGLARYLERGGGIEQNNIAIGPGHAAQKSLNLKGIVAGVAAVTTAFGDPTRRDIYLFVRARDTGAKYDQPRAHE